jgi:hypothetical protein
VAADSLRPLMTLTWQASDSDALCPGFGAAQAAALLQQMVAGLLADAEDKAAVVATAAAQLRALQHAVSGASTIANAGNADRASSMAVDTPLPLEQLSARCQVRGGFVNQSMSDLRDKYAVCWRCAAMTATCSLDVRRYGSACGCCRLGETLRQRKQLLQR